ncbi:hypothetical protein SAMD00019534_011980 [Acytostelium subglobosum LB1]|uniref:hypothetical protein n=1 Tax=Acytostelium subglobosum LB1 TaxID=1410327 RepID=UPI000644B5E9|nr:hypothetical protein SAMD00019534_011980 [Acytostelium subglobosum LB1]GAM18023.1 hypothetical protein SAMD00019534_011980 [Acytostelium subglobosum LB1]|eukprot:XP_012758619.1 hypothetical protein SAMD00019534_011980 [Acytostelium subglobosum LB1]
MISDTSKQIKVSAPGKVILFGEHAVVLGKTSIATGLSLRTNCTIQLIDEPAFIVSLPDLGLNHELKWTKQELSSLANYKNIESVDSFKPCECNNHFLEELATIHSMKGIQSALFLYCVLSKLKHGVHIHFKSDLPIGAGLGSSGSFNVCLVAGLLRVFDLYACGGCEQCKGTHTCNDTHYTPCAKQLDLINQWSLQGEKIMHGTPSGIDNAVSTYGRAISFTRKDGIKPLDRIPPLRLLITDTRVSRSTKILVEGVVNRHQTYNNLMEPVAVLIDNISKECLAAFDKYFIDSDVEQLQQAIELMIDMNHALLSGCFGVGHKTLDLIATVSKQFGLHSKLTGAGGGGCAITLLKPTTEQTVVDQLKDELRKHGFESWEATIGQPGLLFEK